LERYLQILSIALEAVFANRFRSILTALGIIFGVAAVIAMMAIGSGAKKEILDQIKLVGVNNIVIKPIIEKKAQASSESGSGEKKKTEAFTPGLTLEDAEGILKVIPTVERVSPEVIYETFIIKDGKATSATLSGVTTDFFRIFRLEVTMGSLFSDSQLESGSPVCIIGPTIKSKFFPEESPIGKQIKCGNLWLTVVGVLESRNVSQATTENLGISNYNVNIYAPLSTILLRYKDRSVVTRSSLYGTSSTIAFGGGTMSFASSGSADESSNRNQVDKIVIQVTESEKLASTTEVVKAMLKRRHAGVEDFQVIVPELLLKQEQRTKDIFNIVLGAIASISLIVGGIGIMNIMLASVMERFREIGVRKATGATKRDIIFQFLSEATIISITGGIIGIILGVSLASVIMKITGILTIVSFISIVISFGVSASVGIIFGYIPARKAAEQDPIESLRHD